MEAEEIMEPDVPRITVLCGVWELVLCFAFVQPCINKRADSAAKRKTITCLFIPASSKP